MHHLKLNRFNKHEPLRTAKEMAEEFGITPKVLGAFLRHDKNSPSPVFDNRNGSVNARFCWYNQSEMRKWWIKKQSSNS